MSLQANTLPPDDAARAKRLKSLRFIASFAALLALFYLPLLYAPIDTNVIEPFTRGIAVVSGGLLNLLGQHVVRTGTTLVAGGAGVSIRNGCNGVEAMAFLAAATLAFPAPWRKRLVAAAAGCALVQVLNLLRIVTLFLLQRYAPQYFELFHLAIWQTVIGGACIAFFYAWTSRATLANDAAQSR
jgi:exosortase H (IPTLxxWG-CTERM-specific)